MAEIYGSVIDVQTSNLGAYLTADVPIGSSVLPVTDVSIFDVKGGYIVLSGAIYRYTGIDFATSSLVLQTSSGLLLALGTGIGVGGFADDPIELYPPRPEKKALIDLGVDEGDAVFAIVPHDMTAQVQDGFREEDAREVALLEERTVGELYLKDLFAIEPQIQVEATLGDGVPPIASPTPVVTGWVGALHAKWAAVEGPDFISYQVHISTVSDFTPDGTTLVGTTSGTSFTVRSLPNDLLLAYDTTYYVKLVAFDVDGESPPGSQGSGQLQPITGPDIAASFVYAGEINAAQIVGGEVQADLILSGSIATALSGGRTFMGAEGITIYDPAGEVGTTLGPENSVFKGDAEIGGLTVTGGSSIRGTANELSTGAELRLAAGITAPSTGPSVVQDWESITFTKPGDGTFNGANITSVEKVGTLWVCGYREGTIYKVYRFDAAGVYHSAGAHNVSTSTALQTTMLGVDGRCYTIASNRTILKHRQLFGYTHVLSDDFTASINGAIWTNVSNTVWDAGRAKMTADSALQTANIYDAKEHFFSAKVTRQSGTDTQDLFMTVGDGIDEFAQIKLTGNSLIFRVYFDSEIQFESSVTYNATTHAYWRIVERDTGTDGDFHFYTSIDGEAWVEYWSHDHDFSIAELGDTNLYFLGQEEGGSGTLVAFIDEVRHGPNNDSISSSAFSTQNADGDYMTIGNDGTNLLLAEHDNTGGDDRLHVRTIDPNTFAVLSTYTSANDSAWGGPFAGILKGSFDLGAARYITKRAAGSTADWRPVGTTTGNALLPAEGFPPAIPYIGIAWDGSNFWGLAGGKIYKHTSIKHASGTGVVGFEAAFTWFDSNATGGTHETTVSPLASFSLKKRARLTLTAPAIPGAGGTDDPNSVRFYAGLPAALKLEATTGAGQNSAVFNSLAGTGAAPPGTNDFPGGAPALLKAGSLIISGDGTVVGGAIDAASIVGLSFDPTELGNAVDLDSVTASGTYSQTSDAEAVAGSNYPVDYGGILEVDNAGSIIRQTYTAYRNADSAVYPSVWTRMFAASAWLPWIPLFDDHGTESTVSNFAVASTNWTLTSGTVRLFGKVVNIRINMTRNSTLAVPGDGNITNTDVCQMTAKYRPNTPSDQGGLVGGATGRSHTCIISPDGTIVMTNVDGGDTAGGLDIAAATTMSVLGTYLLA